MSGREFKRRRGKVPLAVLLLLVILVPLDLLAEGGGPERVYFLPQWLPQAQFAGYYVAQDKGFYRRQGLEVIILRGGPEKDVKDSLSRGLAHFGTMLLATGIGARARGLPVVNLAQITQRSALMLVARKDRGIQTPQDLKGKKVSLWPGDFQIQPQAFFRRYGLAVTVVPQSRTMNLFLKGGVDAASAMWYNEYHQLLLAGMEPEELTTFFMADHDLNFPEDGLYCHERIYLQSPDRARRFALASLEGWRYALEHPEETLDIVMKYVHEAKVPSNRVHQRWMLCRLQELIQPPGAAVPLGFLSEAEYWRVAGQLQRAGIISSIPAYRDFYRGPGASP